MAKKEGHSASINYVKISLSSLLTSPYIFLRWTMGANQQYLALTQR